MDDPADARRTGSVFTRPWLADTVLDIAGYSATKPLWEMKALEPSCGDGVFLRSMIDRLLATLTANDLTLDVAEDAIRAFDIDPRAVDASLRLVVDALVGWGAPASTAHELATTWVRHADFLEVADDVSGFDVAVGNPPYVRYDRIEEVKARRYQERWLTMTARADLYVGFIEASLASLKGGGRLTMICADRWMRNGYGRRLRGLVASTYDLELVATIHDSDAFERRVQAYPAVVSIRRAEPGDALFIELDDFGPTEAKQLVEDVEAARVGRSDRRPGQFASVRSATLGDGHWPSGPPEVMRRMEVVKHAWAPLVDHDGVVTGVGLATGADAVFLTKDPEGFEDSQLVPVVSARDLRGGATTPSRWLVSPWAADGSLIALADYPSVGAHLEEHRTALAGRYVAQRDPTRWWRTIDKLRPGLLTSPKLVFPDLSVSIEPHLDRGTAYPLHSVYWLTSSTWDLEVLGGLLLSPYASDALKAHSVRMGSGRMRVTTQYLRQLRLPARAALSTKFQDELRQAFRQRSRHASAAVVDRLIANVSPAPGLP